MPIHDWTRVEPALFHSFHAQWVPAVAAALNAGVLPAGYGAYPELAASGTVPDVLALTRRPPTDDRPGGTAVAVLPPAVKPLPAVRSNPFLRRTNRVAIRHNLGELIAVIEIVSPGNKDRRTEVEKFAAKVAGFLETGVHAMVVDVFPPGRHDRGGLHRAILDAVAGDDSFSPPPDLPLLVAAYDAGPDVVPYVANLAVGDEFPDAPLFLKPGEYVPCPLARAYAAAMATFPAEFRELVAG